MSKTRVAVVTAAVTLSLPLLVACGGAKAPADATTSSSADASASVSASASPSSSSSEPMPVGGDPGTWSPYVLDRAEVGDVTYLAVGQVARVAVPGAVSLTSRDPGVVDVVAGEPGSALTARATGVGETILTAVDGEGRSVGSWGVIVVTADEFHMFQDRAGSNDDGVFYGDRD